MSFPIRHIHFPSPLQQRCWPSPPASDEECAFPKSPRDSCGRRKSMDLAYFPVVTNVVGSNDSFATLSFAAHLSRVSHQQLAFTCYSSHKQSGYGVVRVVQPRRTMPNSMRMRISENSSSWGLVPRPINSPKPARFRGPSSVLLSIPGLPFSENSTSHRRFSLTGVVAAAIFSL